MGAETAFLAILIAPVSNAAAMMVAEILARPEPVNREKLAMPANVYAQIMTVMVMKMILVVGRIAMIITPTFIQEPPTSVVMELTRIVVARIRDVVAVAAALAAAADARLRPMI